MMSWGDITRGKGKEKGKEITHVQGTRDGFMIQYISLLMTWLWITVYQKHIVHQPEQYDHLVVTRHI